MPLSPEFRQMDYFALLTPEKGPSNKLCKDPSSNLAMRCEDVGLKFRLVISTRRFQWPGNVSQPQKSHSSDVGERLSMAQEVRPENDIMFNLMFVLFPIV
jgi:hypothetical protein